VRISADWLRDFVDIPESTDVAEFAREITLKTVEVEDVVAVDSDVVFEIDNKSLTNRPDLWGHYGMAREVAAICGAKLAQLPSGSQPPAAQHLVGELDPAICRRFVAIELELAADAGAAMATPAWMSARLARIGEQAVHPLVDLSNYVMFTTGQPTHVYDQDRVTLPLSVGPAGTASTLELVTGMRADLDPNTPVVRDQDGPVAVAGVMGSAASAVSATSRRFVLEVAAFRGRPVRAASTRLGLRTEASARYEKELDTQRVDAAIDLFLTLLPEVAPGVRATAWQDSEVETTIRAEVNVDLAFLAARIGTDLGEAEITRTLESLGFAVQASDGHMLVVAPTWRSTGDITGPHDIVEEVARIHGYDNLPSADITVRLTPPPRKRMDRVIREQLATRAGLHEVITYPWVSEQLLLAVGDDPAVAVRTIEAPAPDQASLRESLLPGLLQAVVANLPNRPAFGIFEVGAVFETGQPVPKQSTMAAATLVGDDGATLFRRMKGILELLGRHGHLIDLGFELCQQPPSWADTAACLAVTCQGRPAGAVGLLKRRTARAAGLSDHAVACFELDVAALVAYPSRDNHYEAVPELPGADFDVSVIAADDVQWNRLARVASGAHRLVHGVTYVDEFRGSWVPDGRRSITLRVTLRAVDATLTAEVIADARAAVLTALDDQLDARVRDA
jgi:phenylalanyl-tRNA synthetase beta chain